MKIGPVDHGERPLRPEDEHQRRTGDGPVQKERLNQSDSVEISPNGRRLADEADRPPAAGEPRTESIDSSRVSDKADAAESPEPDDAVSDLFDLRARRARIEEAARRVESGHYNDPAVREVIARRIADDLLG